MSEALKTLLRSLSIIGIDSERIDMRSPTPEEIAGPYSADEVLVFIRQLPEGSKIRILVTETYHRYPGLPCYFVNFNHANGNFMACQGTPHIEQALFDLGQCFQMIPPIQGD